jgi:hypothetical protein
VFAGTAVVAGWSGMSVYDIESGEKLTITEDPVLAMAVDSEVGFAGIMIKFFLFFVCLFVLTYAQQCI